MSDAYRALVARDLLWPALIVIGALALAGGLVLLGVCR